MKYTCELNINIPRKKVIELFDNPDNLKKWQPELVSFEHMSGEPGQVGAKSKLRYKMGKREVDMIETITVRNLPDEFSGSYEAKGVFNTFINKFEAIDENTTRWWTESDFQFSGFMSIMSIFMGGAMRKQTETMMNNFKQFAESSD
jgi:hypothetical protein